MVDEPIRTERDYRRWIAEHDRSELTVREFTRRRGIPYWTFLKVRRRLAGGKAKKRVARASKPTMLPVRVQDPNAGRETRALQAVLELRGSGHRILLTTTAGDLAQLIRALETPAC